MSETRVKDEHAWFRVRLDTHALGLLDDGEERLFVAHASSCTSCAAALKAHRENAPVGGPDPHIPAHMIARWDRALRRLKGLRRRMIREHLEQCVACQQDLEMLGFAPRLAYEVDLETAASEAAELKPLPDEGGRVIVVKRSRPSARDHWSSGVAGGLLGAALATAAAVLVVPTFVRERVSAIAPTRVSQAPKPTAPSGVPIGASQPGDSTSVGKGINLLPRPLTITPPTRGSSAPEPTLSLESADRALALSIPAQIEHPDEVASAIVTFFTPHDSAAYRIQVRPVDLSRSCTVLLERPATGWEAGTYRLVVEMEPAAGALVQLPQRRTLTFRIRLADKSTAPPPLR